MHPRISLSSSSGAGPRFGNLAPANDVVHHENQLVVVVAVENFDVDAGLGHASREKAELTRDGLLQSLHDHVPFRDDADASRFQRLASRGSVLEEEMAD